jgi:hypothetical protein
LKGAAFALAARGDSSALRYVLQRDREADAAVLMPTRYQLAQNDDWNVKPIIYDHRVLAHLISDNPLVYATMTHDGHVGKIRLGYDLTFQDGSHVASFGPVTQTGFNPLGRFNRQNIDMHVDVGLPGQCGYRIRASGDFESYNINNPYSIDLGPIDLPSFRSQSALAADHEDGAQADCVIPTRGGGGGGGDSGYYLVYTECWGYHLYSGGSYVGSVIEGCSQNSSWISTGNAT